MYVNVTNTTGVCVRDVRVCACAMCDCDVRMRVALTCDVRVTVCVCDVRVTMRYCDVRVCDVMNDCDVRVSSCHDVRVCDEPDNPIGHCLSVLVGACRIATRAMGVRVV